MDERDFASRLVLVREVDLDMAYASVTLLSPELSMATDIDMILTRAQTGLGYDLLLETDLETCVWLVQVQAAPPVATVEPSRELVPAGPRVLGPDDPGWLWKESELSDLNRLSAECVRQLVDGRSPMVVDPSSMSPATENPTFSDAALAALRACKSGDAVVTPRTIAALAQIGNKRADIAAACVGLSNAVARVNGCLYKPYGQASNFMVPGRMPVEDDELSVILADCVDHGRRSVRLLTTSALWRSEYAEADLVGGSMVFEAHVNGSRCQVVTVLTDDARSVYV